jgi:membrane protease YdiL (CAAX protease family)
MMETQPAPRNPLRQALVFSLLVLILRWVPHWIVGGETGGDETTEVFSGAGALHLIALLSPLLAALVVRKVLTRDGFSDAGLGFKQVKGLFWLLAVLLPVVWHGLDNMADLALGRSVFEPGGFDAGKLAWGLLPVMLWVLPEEIGWRGTLLVRLRPLGIHPAIILTAVVWYLWHPQFFLNDNPWLVKVVFLVNLVLLSYVMGWVFFQTRSIWPCVVIHALHNLLYGLGVFRTKDDASGIWGSIVFMGALLLVTTVLWLLFRPRGSGAGWARPGAERREAVRR